MICCGCGQEAKIVKGGPMIVWQVAPDQPGANSAVWHHDCWRKHERENPDKRTVWRNEDYDRD